MHTGKIKKVMRDRGFGFINDTDGREVFFHQSSVVGTTFDRLNSDDKVTFEVENGPKGPCAVNVNLVKESE